MLAAFSDSSSDPVASAQPGDDFAWILGPESGAQEPCDGAHLDSLSGSVGLNPALCRQFLLLSVPIHAGA